MAQQNSTFKQEWDAICNHIDVMHQESIAFYDAKIAQYSNWYNTPISTPEPAPQQAQVEESAPLTPQEIYEISKKGGEGWQSILKQIKEQWT